MSTAARTMDEGAPPPEFLLQGLSKQETRRRERYRGSPLSDFAPRDHVDMGALADAVTTNPLDDIAAKLQALTYKEMMELSEAFHGRLIDRQISADVLADAFHKWSTSR